MSEHQPADDHSYSPAEVLVHPVGHGWWSWRYVERDSGIELQSNDTFRSRESAVESAKKAYPDLDVSEDSEGPEGSEDAEEDRGEMREPPPLL